MTSPKLIYGDEVAAVLTQALTTDLIQDVERRHKFLEQAGLLLTDFFGGDLVGIGHADVVPQSTPVHSNSSEDSQRHSFHIEINQLVAIDGGIYRYLDPDLNEEWNLPSINDANELEHPEIN